MPFESESLSQMLCKIKVGQYSLSENPIWEIISEEAKHLLSKMLCVSSDHRLSAYEALMHPAIFTIPIPIIEAHKFLQYLRSYSKVSFIAQCARAALVKFIEYGEKSKEKIMFLEFDRKMSGVVTALEVCDTFEEIGVIVNQIEIFELMNKVGIREKGKLYFGEFVSCLIVTPIGEDECCMRMAFEYFDRDRKGLIDESHFVKALRFLGKSVSIDLVNETISEVTNSEFFTFEDFKKLF